MMSIMALLLVACGVLLLLSPTYWPATWLIILLLPLTGVVYSIGSGSDNLSIQGVDLSLGLLLLLSLRRVELPAGLVRWSVLLLFSSLVLMFGGVSESLSYAILAMKISVGSVLAVIAGYKTAASSSNFLRWFYWGVVILLSALCYLLVARYRSNGVGILEEDPTLKQYLTTPIGSSNYIASIAVLLAGSAHFLAQGFRRGRSFMALLLTYLGLALALITQSKWGTVCAVILAFTNTILVLKSRVPGWERLAALFATVLLSLWGISLLTKLSVVEAVLGTSVDLSQSSSGVGRLDIWQVVWYQFGREPFFGAGLGWEPELYGGQRQLAHNTVLELLGQGGLLLFVVFSGLVLYLSIRAVQAVGFLVVPILMAGFLSGLLEPTFRTGFYDVLFFSLLGLCFGMRRRAEDVEGVAGVRGSSVLLPVQSDGLVGNKLDREIPRFRGS